MKTGRTLTQLAMELERQLATKKDLIVPATLMRHRTSGGGECRLAIDEPDGCRDYAVTELARRQLAEKLKIPFLYFERMRIDQPQLLDTNVNTWLANDNDRRLVRTLDGHVRAVLSDRYRRLDNVDLAEHVLPILQRLPEARFESVELTDTRMYLKVVTPRVQAEIAPGDIVQAGVVVANSEVGCGTLSVQPLVFRLLCRNGLIASDGALKKTHVGRLLSSAEESVVVYKDDTLQADDRAFFLKVRDVVEAAVSEASFRLVAGRMAATRGIRIAGDPVKSVEVLANRFSLSEGERAGVLRHLIAEGDLSAYGLVNALTGYSQDVDDYDRATEFEQLGGKLLDLSHREWQDITLAT
jgi:hypothetical protein